MSKKLCSIQALPETRLKLKEIAKKERRSMAGSLEVLVQERHKKILSKNNGNDIRNDYK